LGCSNHATAGGFFWPFGGRLTHRSQIEGNGTFSNTTIREANQALSKDASDDEE
jgi:hypothetical protein